MTKAKNKSAILISSVQNKCWIKSRPFETLDLSAICWEFSHEKKNVIINFRTRAFHSWYRFPSIFEDVMFLRNCDLQIHKPTFYALTVIISSLFAVFPCLLSGQQIVKTANIKTANNEGRLYLAKLRSGKTGKMHFSVLLFYNE